MVDKRRRVRPQRPRLDWMVLPNSLAYVTAWYGLFVGKFPGQILCAAVGIGLIFSAGFHRIEVEQVTAEDYLPTDSPSIRERSVIKMFDAVEKDNQTSQYARILYNQRRKRDINDRFITTSSFAESCRPNSILLIAKKNKTSGKDYNLFDATVFAEIDRFEAELLNIKIPVKRENSNETVEFQYEPHGDYDNGLCTRQPTGECAGFSLQVLRRFFEAGVEPGFLSGDPLWVVFSKIPGIGLTYPQFFNNDFSKYLAKVKTQPGNFVESIGAIRLVYCLNEYFFDPFKSEAEPWLLWEREFNRLLKSSSFESPYFRYVWMAEYQRSGEQNELITNMVPKVAATFFALMLWCCVSALSNDASRSKPWAGLIGISATCFACTTGFGICLWLEPKFNPILMAVPLLVLAIGLDDMFIALEAWNRTDASMPVEERMMATMHLGGTTIFITFLINLIDFVVGNYTPFPLIKKLSTYAIAAMVFDFVFQLTIFAPSLAIFGYVEQWQRQSCCCCFKTKPKSYLESSNFQLICCSRNGTSKQTARYKGPGLLWLVRFLTGTRVRIVSMLAFCGYVALCGWSISRIEIGLKPERVYRQSSNMFAYWQANRQLFSEYSDEIKVVVNNQVDYTLKENRQKVVNFINLIHESGFFWPDQTKCWLLALEDWLVQQNLTYFKTEADLIWQLQRFPGGFLDSNDAETFEPYRPFQRDIRINLNSTSIVKIRFKIRAKDLSSPPRQVGMMTELRRLIDLQKPDLDIYAYGDNFLLYDNFLTAVPTTLYYCGMTLGVTAGVAIFLIPHPACLFWVCVFVTSVLIGILGLMRFWDMDLDSITLINLLIAISFCSDLIAHPIHVFLVSQVPNHSQTPASKCRLIKTETMVEEVAKAALPACVGTILSVMAMATSDAYIFATFFRVMFLSVLLSIIHGLFFVPAFMSYFGPANAGVSRLMDANESDLEYVNEASIAQSVEFAERSLSFSEFIPAEVLQRGHMPGDVTFGSVSKPFETEISEN